MAAFKWLRLCEKRGSNRQFGPAHDSHEPAVCVPDAKGNIIVSLPDGCQFDISHELGYDNLFAERMQVLEKDGKIRLPQ